MIRPSDTVPLGETGLRVTRLGLGMRPLGLLPPGQESTGRAIIGAAARLGVALFDTAPTYGNGESERRLGEMAPALPASIVVSTKVGRLLGAPTPRRPLHTILAETITGGPAAAARLTLKAARVLRGATVGTPSAPGSTATVRVDFSYDATMRSVEESLGRVAGRHLDIVLMHTPDRYLEAAMTGAYPALRRLREDGTITALGVGSSRCEVLVRMAQEGDFDCFLLAGRYSLLDQTAIEVLLPTAAARGIAIIVGGVFNGGLLADPLHAKVFDNAPASPERVAQARRISDICIRHGVDVKAAALQFPFGHPAVASVLVGASSVAELEEDERLARAPVPTAVWDELRSEGLLVSQAPVPNSSDGTNSLPGVPQR